jgi:exopolysaccharide production protein ExoZ
MGRNPSDAAHAEAPALASVQYRRGAAALAVAAFHALQWCDGGFDVGRAGVDVFFIISGVIMWRVTAAPQLRPADFLARRVTRVAPLYWAATLTVWVLALWWRGFLPEVEPPIPHLLLSLAFNLLFKLIYRMALNYPDRR